LPIAIPHQQLKTKAVKPTSIALLRNPHGETMAASVATSVAEAAVAPVKKAAQKLVQGGAPFKVGQQKNYL